MNVNRLVCTAALLAAAAGQSFASGPAPLAWRTEVATAGCRAAAAVEPTRGGIALELLTRSPFDDPSGLRTELRVAAERADGKALCTLGELAAPGASLGFGVFRDPASGEGMPDYTCPYMALRVRAADGRVVRLLWEAPYNGYMTKTRFAFPEGVWVPLQTATGRFWMATDAALFNGKDGFQPLKAWADGHVTEWRSNRTAALDAGSPVLGLELGSGNGLPGVLHAYVDDVVLTLTNGAAYRLDPLLNRSAPAWTNVFKDASPKGSFSGGTAGPGWTTVPVCPVYPVVVRDEADGETRSGYSGRSGGGGSPPTYWGRIEKSMVVME